MKKIILLLLPVVSLFSCKNKRGIPDVSGISVELTIDRFDKTLFSADTADIPTALQRLREKHPDFYDDFMKEVLGVSGSATDSSTLFITRQFIRDYASVYDSIQIKYRETGWLKKELQEAFRFVKYYFPGYKPGKIFLYMGPFDAPGVASTKTGLAIGLHQFAGKDFSIYRTGQMQKLFPLYISRRFSPEYITANCMKAVVLDLFPDQSAGKPLIEQMVEKGKQWWLLSKLLPHIPDSIKTGYTALQLKWCRENEGLIWSDIVRNEDLNSLNPTVIQTYIGEGPFTQGFSQEYSPGNLGQWLGWQMVKKFVSKNPDMKPEEVMNTPARKILDEAKYKPK
jgi:hypothetical protein